jgi:hypothetical protein
MNVRSLRLRPAIVRAAALCGALATQLVGCSHAAPPPAGPIQVVEVDAHSELERFFPLQDGTVFSYETTSEGTAGHGTLIVQISRPRKGRADLRMGSRTERLELAPDAIAYVQGGFLLKAPLASGTTWKGKSGTVKITGTDESAKVPAGQFEGCLRTVEESRDSTFTRSVSSLYCPHVGLVSVDVEASTPEGHARETAVLKSFGPRVDVGPEDVTTTTQEIAGPAPSPEK